MNVGPELLAGALSEGARRQRAALAHAEHRPWPLPRGPWVMGQSWLDVLFLHWPVPAPRLRALVDARLELDLYGGSGWMSVTPFEVAALRPRGAPPAPVGSRFPELNVRTYVTVGGRPGIAFASLDAGSAVAVAAARALYRLPYFRACMQIARSAAGVDYASERVDRRGPPAAFAAAYRPLGTPAAPPPGSLEAWLVERYRLFTVHRGRVLAADIHHAPWTLQPVDLDLRTNTMLAQIGLELGPPALVHLGRRQDVLVWPPRRP